MTVLFSLWLAMQASPGLEVDAAGCPEFDRATIASVLELELSAEHDADATRGRAVVRCDDDSITLEVQRPDGVGRRRIEGPDRTGLTERTIALALAPLFAPAPTQLPEPPPPAPVPPPTAEVPQAAPAPVVPESSAPAPAADAAAEAPPAPIAAIVRPSGFMHDAPGVGGQLGFVGWVGARLGLGLATSARWGRAERARGQIDTIVATAGPLLAVRLGQGRLRFRAELGAGLGYASLRGRSSRTGTRAANANGFALDAIVGLGPQIAWPRWTLVPQLVVGSTFGAPVGTVSNERDVSLTRPFVGLAVSIEPWLRLSSSP